MSNEEFEIGGVYQDSKKNRAIFINYVNTTIYKIGETISDNEEENNCEKATFNFELSVIQKGAFFYEIFGLETLTKSLKEMVSKKVNYQFKIKSNFPYTQKIDQVELPIDLIEGLRNKALKVVKDDILEFTGHTDVPPSYRIDSRDLSRNISYYSQYLNLYLHGGTPVTPFDVRKLLLFS